MEDLRQRREEFGSDADKLKKLVSKMVEEGVSVISNDTLADLRDEVGKREKGLANWWQKRNKENTFRFETIVWTDTLLKEQKDIDFSIIQEQLFTWHTNAKNDEQKKILMNLIKCMWRVEAYYGSLETAVYKAITEMREAQADSARVKKEFKEFRDKEHAELLKENDKLKMQIKFHEENG